MIGWIVAAVLWGLGVFMFESALRSDSTIGIFGRIAYPITWPVILLAIVFMSIAGHPVNFRHPAHPPNNDE